MSGPMSFLGMGISGTKSILVVSMSGVGGTQGRVLILLNTVSRWTVRILLEYYIFTDKF